MNGDLFDFGSAYVRRALVGFAAVYVVVTIGTCTHITSPLRWAGLLSAFVVLVLIALRLQAAPCGLWCAWLLTACVVAAVALAWWSLPTDGYGVLQSGPATVGGVVAFTLLMVRGHPVVAWCGALTMSAVCVVWSVSRGDGVSAGLNTTLPAYPVLTSIFREVAVVCWVARVGGLRTGSPGVGRERCPTRRWASGFTAPRWNVLSGSEVRLA
ncbi:Uncharacterised protein [Gordonia paraffinivorans]|uniref:Uncharacterized protein n=2 Tax=Gordonia paraffinivorans TaxID=175628 RepID=A0ABD7V1L0_9ACTN|nr:Uncharacterised protein [Gordonia paraffinivorans]